MKIIDIPVKLIRIPSRHARIKKEDNTLFNSMKTEGLKVPVVVVANKKEYILADGGRRVSVARRLGWSKISADIRDTKDSDPEAYASFLRLIINYHRSGFYPSQRAHYLNLLCNKFNYSISEIAAACGVSRSGLRHWMAVDECNDEIRMFIDDGKFPVDSGRYLRTLKPAGQIMIADQFREKQKVSLKELRNTVREIHRKYPELIKITLKQAFKQKSSPGFISEKKGYTQNLSLAEMEEKIYNYEKEITFMRREIIQVKDIIQKICKNSKIRLALPGTALKKFDTFLAED